VSRDLVVVGAGGFGREALDVIEASVRAGATLRVLGVVDTRPSEENLGRLRERGVAYLGTEDAWLGEQREGLGYVIGVGAPMARERAAGRLDEAGLTATTVIHPSAVVGTRAEVSGGVVICAGVQVSTNVTLGRHAHLNPGVIVGHDAVVEDYASLNPGAIVSGEVRVGRGALIGAGAVVLQGLRVGEGATVGAAACVVRDVAPGVVVKGVPAR
jgi:sugar O-acyltransferase (sialic acid O-acetyltransferase NeuD family)